jgi:hypothetical protein
VSVCAAWQPLLLLRKELVHRRACVLDQCGMEPLHQVCFRKLVLPCLRVPVFVPDGEGQHRLPDMPLSDCRPQEKLKAA